MPKKQRINQRYIPVAVRRQVLALFGFKCPICDFPIRLDIHHILFISLGGSNDPENLIPLCPRCHDLVHALKPDPGVLSRIRDRWFVGAICGKTELELCAYLRHKVQFLERGQKFSDYYIDQLLETSKGTSEQAVSAILRWLECEDGVLVILGGSGSGKTTLASALFITLAERFLTGSYAAQFPLLVPLGICRDLGSVQSLVNMALLETQLSYERLLESRFLGNTVMLLDGFDEFSDDINVPTPVRDSRFLSLMHSLGMKCIIFSRTNSFSRNLDPSNLFAQPVTLDEIISGREEGSLAQVWKLQPFNTEQIQAYLKKTRPKDAVKLYRKIEETYDLPDLATEPLLLRIIVAVADQGILDLPVVDIVNLYNAFLRCWVNNERLVKRRSLDEVKMIEFCQALARYMFCQRLRITPEEVVNSLIDKICPGQDKDGFALFARISGIFQLNENGNWSFGHSSFQEFLVAKLLMHELECDITPELWDMRELPSNVVRFVAQMIKNQKEIIRLHHMLEDSDSPNTRRNVGICLRETARVYTNCPITVKHIDVNLLGNQQEFGDMWEALAISGWIRCKDTHHALRAVLAASPHPRLVRIALLSLGFWECEADVDLIKEVYHRYADNEMVGGACVFALAFIGGVSARSFTHDCLLESPFVVVRRAAAWSIEASGDRSAAIMLAKLLLEDPAEEVRQYCAHALGKVGSPALIDKLSLSTQDSCPGVRIASYKSLAMIAGEQSRLLISELARNESDFSVNYTIQSLLNDIPF